METAGDVLTWRPLVANDLPLLARWLRDPQVARWWNHEYTDEAVERDFGASVRGEEPGEDLVVSLDGHLVGLVQRSVIGDYPKDLAEFSAVIEVPDGAVELDYLIGEGPMEPENPVDDPLHYVYRIDRPTPALSGTSR